MAERGGVALKIAECLKGRHLYVIRIFGVIGTSSVMTDDLRLTLGAVSVRVMELANTTGSLLSPFSTWPPSSSACRKVGRKGQA